MFVVARWPSGQCRAISLRFESVSTGAGEGFHPNLGGLLLGGQTGPVDARSALGANPLTVIDALGFRRPMRPAPTGARLPETHEPCF